MPRTGHPTQSLTIHKFGGAALATAQAMRRAAAIVATYNSVPRVVVVSAMSGVTDQLLAAAVHASTGRADDARHAIGQLGARHRAVLRELETAHGGEPGTSASRAHSGQNDSGPLDAIMAELRATVELLASHPSRVAELTDALVVYGERLSARLFVAALGAAGVRASMVDATTLIATDGRFGAAAPDVPGTRLASRHVLLPLLTDGTTPVVPGFTGAAPSGAAVTLGRGGSDLTATLLAQALGAREVHLWKDVPGLLTADPRVVPVARVLPRVTAREAAELAYYGAQVLHPRSLVPMHGAMRVFVRPFADPTAAGTEISHRRAHSGPPVRAISAIANQAMVTISGNGMLGVPGIAARTFGAMADARLSVSLITQASSEHSISFALPESDSHLAAERLKQAFAEELHRRDIDSIDVVPGLATIAIVGANMVRTPGIAARIFTALADASVNVVAIAQGSSELNVSVVVAGAQAPAAVRAIHAAFHLDKLGRSTISAASHCDIILLGFGAIGRETARHIVAGGAALRARLRVVAVMDRGGFLFAARGLSERQLAAAALAKARGASVSEVHGGGIATPAAALAVIAGHALSRPVLVDAASGDTGDVISAAIGHGMHVVLANKVPLTADRATLAALMSRATASGHRVLYEATVGAGLPVIDTYEKLVESGDRVLRIEGCPSGTLGYVFGELGRGVPFSDAVRGAMALGYTEPDVRDDLSGVDVARKALILGRLLGFDGELSDVPLESLVPDTLRTVSVHEFHTRVHELDGEWRLRAEAEAARGHVLRYRAIVSRRSVRVGVVAVPLTSALAALSGTDNQFAFTTVRYRRSPLVITGPGAGAAVTAGGVMNDLMKLSNPS